MSQFRYLAVQCLTIFLLARYSIFRRESSLVKLGLFLAIWRNWRFKPSMILVVYMIFQISGGYAKKVLKISIVFAVAWNALILAGTPLLLRYYNLGEETKTLIFQLVIIHNVFCAFVSPFTQLGNGLRAAGDIKFTMITSIIATLAVRLVFSYILGQWLSWGVIGIAVATCMNWIASAIAYTARLKSGKWKQFKII